MKINIELDTQLRPGQEPLVGNVYPVKGGRGLRYGHMHVLFHITDSADHRGQMCLLIVIDKDGSPIGVNSYGLHYIEELQPIAFVDGLDAMEFTMRSL
jgi:hypothetical protein